jgi:hypothetical protein
MKNVCIALFVLAGFGYAGCTYKTHPHGMPPGQAKKVYGTQSAKPFAPGQQKNN